MKTLGKKLLLLLLVINTIAFAAEVKTLTVYFDKDKFELRISEKAKLEVLKNADVVTLLGHTDNDGSNGYNIQLSQNRVMEVRKFISAMDASIRFETDYFGENKPINTNRDETAKAQNRRVEISYISDPLLRSQVRKQFFTIDNSKDQVITGVEGTEVHIPAGAFAGKNVQITLSEYYNPLQILSANLCTKSNGRPIETAGMINIGATINGEKVEPSEVFTVKFPRNNKSKDFKFFAGQRNEQFEMNWVTGSTEKAVVQPPQPTAEAKSATTDSQIVFNTKYRVTDFGGLNMEWAIKGLLPEFEIYVSRMKEAFSATDFAAVQNCLPGSVVNMTVDAGGNITALFSDNQDTDADCDWAVRQFVRRYMPKHFKAPGEETMIRMEFEINDRKKVVAQQNWFPFIAVNDNNYIADFGGGFAADYEADKIVLKATKLGWINCDRFLNTPLTNYTISTDAGANVRLILKKYKSYFVNEFWAGKGSVDLATTEKARQNGHFIFNRVPNNEDAVVVSTKKENDKIFLAIQHVKIAANSAGVNLTYKAVTQKELEAALKELEL